MGWRAGGGVVRTEGWPEDDVYFFECDGDDCVLHAGELAVSTPQDGHRPGLAVDGPAQIKKIVVKVAM